MSATATNELTLDTIIATLDPLRELGGHVIDVNYAYQQGLSQRLIDVGKPVARMTVGELLRICNEYNAEFHRRHLGIQS